MKGRWLYDAVEWLGRIWCSIVGHAWEVGYTERGNRNEWCRRCSKNRWPC